MGGLPSREAPEMLFTLRYGRHEVGLVPLIRRHFHNGNPELKRQYVRLRNDPSIRYTYLRNSAYSMVEQPPATYTEKDLESLLSVIDDGLFESNAEWFEATDPQRLHKEANVKESFENAYNGFERPSPRSAITTDASVASDEHLRLLCSTASDGYRVQDDDAKWINVVECDPSQSTHELTPTPAPGELEEQVAGMKAGTLRQDPLFSYQDGDRTFLADESEKVDSEEYEHRRRFKRALRPVPCAVVFVYTDRHVERDGFNFMGKCVNVIGYIGPRTHEDGRDDNLPYLQVRKAILKAAGDRTMERAISLAAVLYVKQFAHVVQTLRPMADARLLLQERLECIPLVITTQWNSYPTMKYLFDSAALLYAGLGLKSEDMPFHLSMYERPSGEKGIVAYLSGSLLSKCWAWTCDTLKTTDGLDGTWVQYTLQDGVQPKETFLASWLASSPYAHSFFGGERFTRMACTHLEELHSEVVRARFTPEEDEKSWAPGEEHGHDKKVYRIFLSPRCGPILTTVKRSMDTDARKRKTQRSHRDGATRRKQKEADVCAADHPDSQHSGTVERSQSTTSGVETGMIQPGSQCLHYVENPQNGRHPASSYSGFTPSVVWLMNPGTEVRNMKGPTPMQQPGIPSPSGQQLLMLSPMPRVDGLSLAPMYPTHSGRVPQQSVFLTPFAPFENHLPSLPLQQLPMPPRSDAARDMSYVMLPHTWLSTPQVEQPILPFAPMPY